MKAAIVTINYTTRILKFSKMGEKTGWTYIEVPAHLANKLLPGNMKSFRVKGKLDEHEISGASLLPMGEGNFILPFNAKHRKATGKKDGQLLKVQLSVDRKKLIQNRELLICLKEEPDAFSFFKSLPMSHQNYFSKWIDEAKTDETKAKRIARSVNALLRKMHYGQMLKIIK